MLRLAVLLIAAAFAAPAAAADLPVRSPIGRIFAEPAPPAQRQPLEMATGMPVYAPEVDIPAIVHGYYGKPNSYLYQSYYGTSPITIFTRLPYACGWHGYC